MTNNVYIHIPFCVQKCNYCAFVSYCKLQRKKEYVEALLREIKEFYQRELIKTLYFGGGTPSLLSIQEISSIMDKFEFDTDAEVTFEVNPNNLKQEYLSKLREKGINRLSIGAQTFDEKTLKIIGRLHTPLDIEKAVKNARKAGFENISLDLIYGLPGQSLAFFEEDLKRAISLGVEHISLYGLKIEEGTCFFEKQPKNLPDDDLQADMYLLAGDVLRYAGYDKYEISNFARENYFSRHNLNYWNANTYYGFGCGAHGYENNIRYENQVDLDLYIKNPCKKQNKILLSKEDKRQEKIFLGFRKSEGIDVNELKIEFDYDFNRMHGDSVVKFLDTGHLYKTPKGYALSDKGFLLSNLIISQCCL